MSLTVSPVSIDHKLPLSQAIAQLGTRVQGGYMSFGIDVRENPEPEVELKIAQPVGLGVALAQILSQANGYAYQPISEHVIEVYPVRESSDPSDLLNMRVREFAAKREPATNIFSKPARFIPELNDYFLKGKTMQACGSIGPGLASAGPGISLDLRGMTLRQILDAVAEADATLAAHYQKHDLPVGWIHKLRTDQEGKTVHVWSFLSTVPHDWERYMPQQEP